MRICRRMLKVFALLIDLRLCRCAEASGTLAEVYGCRPEKKFFDSCPFLTNSTNKSIYVPIAIKKKKSVLYSTQPESAGPKMAGWLHLPNSFGTGRHIHYVLSDAVC